MKTLLIDNYDSFTFNLYQVIAEVNGVAPIVVRNDCAPWAQLRDMHFDNIVISPGPGRPEVATDFGVCADAIRETTTPLLGVCLGHQGLCHLFGGTVDYADQVMHGRPSDVLHNEDGPFKDIPSPFSVIRYHSLHVTEVPPELEAIAWTDDNILMGVRHKEKPIWGVQFHPESISTEYGHTILKNFQDLTAEHLAIHPPKRRKTDGARPRRPSQRFDVSPKSDYTFQHASTGTIHGKPMMVKVRRIPFFVDAEQTFMKHYAESKPSFWLDSALVKGFSRFSYMGDARGPHAEMVTYDLETNRVEVAHQGVTTVHEECVFDYLERTLLERKTDTESIPFDFNLGYAGYFGYELKASCCGQQAHHAVTPDAAFVFADRIVVFDHEERISYLICLDDEDNEERAQAWIDSMLESLNDLAPSPPPDVRMKPIQVEQTFRHTADEYLHLINACQRYIKRGESYEICLTNMITQHVTIDPVNTYRVLRASNPAPYATFLNFEEVAVLSSSPERFITINANGVVESKPIKGTRRRGDDIEEDEALHHDLRTNEKDRSENLMIVDLLRNDIGSVSNVGSVHVSRMFAVESYETVHQLVSTIQGKLRPGISAVRCIQAAFPGGSMTGAPKIRTMEIIDKLEAGPRGVYSGSLGFLGLNGSADLNIVIRTIVIDSNGDVTVGVGGAIVDLSDPHDELEEMLLKSRAVVSALGRTAKSGSDVAVSGIAETV